MNKQDILAKFKENKLKTKVIHIKSIDMDLTIRELTGNEYIEVSKDMTTNIYLNNMIMYSVIDEEGNRVFDNDEIIKSLNSVDYEYLASNVLVFNGINIEAKNKTKNLKITN